MKRITTKISLFLIALGAIYLIVEFLIFPSLIRHIPLKNQNRIHHCLRFLSQSSKDKTIPKDYILLLGDSYAQGLGDWFYSANKWKNPPFHSAHILNDATGIDVVTFAQGGLSHLSAMVLEPTLKMEFIRKTKRFKLEDPEFILIYFYEGNDLNDNIRDLEKYYPNNINSPRFPASENSNKFIGTYLTANKKYNRYVQNVKFSDRFIFLDYIEKSYKEIRQKIAGTEPDWEELIPKTMGPGTTNYAWINGNKTKIPDLLQGPGHGLTSQQLIQSYGVFEKSVQYIKTFFPKSKIGLLYIPSVLTCYDLASNKSSVMTLTGETFEIDSKKVPLRSDQVFSEIKSITERNQIHILDARPYFQSLAKQEKIHGERDFLHFNKKGHRRLAEAAEDLVEDLKL